MNEQPPKRMQPGDVFPKGFENWSAKEKGEFMEGKIDEFKRPIGEAKPEESINIEVPDYSLQEEMNEQEEPTFSTEQIGSELSKKLEEAGVKVEVVEALPNLAIYDESEKILKVRRDAPFSFVKDYTESAIFREQDGIDELPDEDRSDYISLEDDKNKEPKEGGSSPEEKQVDSLMSLDVSGYKPKSEKETEKEKEELAAKISAAQNLEELYAVLRGAGRVQGSRGRFYDAEELIQEIEGIKQMVEAGGISDYSRILTQITSAAGLRDKVEELVVGKKEEKPVEVLPTESEELKAPEKEQVIEKIPQTEKLVFGPEEIKNVIAGQLGGKATINRLDISETGDGVKLDAELDAGMMGGKIILNGVIKNSGDGIVVGDLNVEARGYVKSMIEKNLSNFTPAIKNYFEKQEGKPVVGMKIVGSSLEVEFKNNNRSDESELEPKEEAPKEKATPESNPEIPQDIPLGEESVSDWRNSEEWKKFEVMGEDVARKEARQKEAGLVSLGVELGKSEYFNYKEEIAKKIKESLTAQAGQNLSLEQQRELNRKINDTIYNELLVNERATYKKQLNEKRAETIGDKAKEALKATLSSKGYLWYMGLGTKKKLALRMLTSFVVGGTIGVAAGAAASVGLAGYAGLRASRVISGAGLGAGAKGVADSVWSIEKINKEEQEKLDELKNNSGMSLEEKSRKYEDIIRGYNKKRIKARVKSMIATAAVAGAGSGALSGFLHDSFVGIGGSRSAIESQGSKTGNVEPNSKPRVTEPVKPTAPTPEPVKPSVPQESAPEVTKTSDNVETPEVKIEPPPTVAAPKSPEPTPEVQTKTEPLFTDPSILKHQNVQGDSTWKIVEKTLENNDKFKSLTEAQKTYVGSHFTNKILKDPDIYGVGKDGSLEIGKETDLTKLFEDSKEAESVFEKAKEITAGSLREKTILENNAKIATWVADPNNKGKVWNESRVSEILNTKPKQFFTGEQAKEFLSQAEKPKSSDVKLSESLRDGSFAETDEKVIPGSIEELMQDKMDALKTPEHNEFSTTETGVKEAAAQVEETAINNTEVAERLTNRIWAIENMKNVIDPTDTSKMSKFEALLKEAESLKSKIMLGEEVPGVQKTLDEIEKQAHEIINSKPNGVAENVINIKDARAGIEDEIGQYKQRLAQLENNRAAVTGGVAAVAAAPVVAFPGREGFSNIRTLRSDIEASKNSEEERITSAINAGLHDIYGSNGLMGIGKKEGVSTPEWKWMAKLPAAKLVKYYSGNSNEAGLSPQTMETLSKSKKHREFANQMLDLIKRTESVEDRMEKIDARPFENENTEQFMRRLLGYVLPKPNSQNLQKVA